MVITKKHFISCGLCSCLTSTKLDRYGRFWTDSYVQRNQQKTHVLKLIVAVAHCKCLFFSMILLQSVEFLWHFLPFLSWWNRFFVCSFSSYSFLFCLRIITRTNPLILQCPEWKFVVCKLWTLNILPARSCWVVPLRSRFSSWGCLYVLEYQSCNRVRCITGILTADLVAHSVQSATLLIVTNEKNGKILEFNFKISYWCSEAGNQSTEVLCKAALMIYDCV